MCEFKDRQSFNCDDDDDHIVPALERYIRYGGAQGEDAEDELAKKTAERERKKAEVRKRLEEAGRAKKAKKGFLTPERKKKLRKLLMMKAAEDMKQQQKLKEQERQKVLGQRIVAMPNVDTVDDKGKLEAVYKDLFARFMKIEGEKYDINCAVRQKDAEITELTIAVNDLRGKYVKPPLKKVSKYDNKFKKMAETKKEDKQDFRSNLKVVKKENTIEEIEKKQQKKDKPVWSKKGGAETDGSGAKTAKAGGAEQEEPEEEQEEAEDEEEEEE